MIASLADRAVIAVSGPEARTFLQGLITNDLDRLTAGHALYAALLTPQGKILFDFLIADDAAGAILIDCWAPAREGLLKRLSMYRLRARVVIQARDDVAVLASWDGTALPGLAFDDPRLAALGRRSLAPAAPSHASGDYLAHRLSLGVPEGADFGSDKIFALDADLDELQAIAFDKGCYVGQELTARMKHRGTARKRLLLVETTSKSALVVGADLRAAGHSIGEIVSVYGSRGFASIRLDRLAEADGAAIDADGVPVTVTKQDWLSA